MEFLSANLGIKKFKFPKVVSNFFLIFRFANHKKKLFPSGLFYYDLQLCLSFFYFFFRFFSSHLAEKLILM